MKTSKTITIVFWFLSFSFFAQHDHEGLEELFHTKSLAVFENDLEFTADDFQNQQALDFVDIEYQSFLSDIRTRLDEGDQLTQAQFEVEYTNKLAATKMQLDLLLEIDSPNPGFPPKMLDGPCVNMDFEDGDFNGWDLTRGNVDGSVPYSFVGEFPVGPSAYHQIFGGGFDPVTGIPTVNPLGGAFSARLGNGTGTGARAARMKQTFLVDATNYLYTYSYAVVFESPNGHALNELPYFTVRVFDELGNNVPCGEYSVIADAASAPDYLTTNWGGTTVLYQDWQTVFTNLSAYIGQNVTIEFTSGDCSLTGHFGYAYVDASCAMNQIIASSNIICTGESAFLTAPAGAASYLWSTGEITQVIEVFAGGNYSCTLTPFQGGGCEIVLDIDITENPSPTANFTSNTVVPCVNDVIDFTDLSTIPNPGIITNYRWDFGDGTITPLSNGAIIAVPITTGTYTAPSHTYTTSGVYNVELYVESADGCSDFIIIPVTINDLPVVVAGVDQTVCDGVAVTLNGAGASIYAWDNGVLNGVPFNQPVGTTTYTLAGTDINGCQNTDQVDVTVNPLPIVIAGLDQTLCIGPMITLSAAGANAYAWDNGVIDGVPFAQGVGSITYTVIGTDLNGCQNTDQLDVTVNALPVVDAGPDQIMCEGPMVTLSGSGANGYVWDNGVINGVPFAQGVGTINYTVIGTDVNGCQNTDQVNVTINALPNVNAGVDQALCLGTSITLNGAGAVGYVWDHGVIDNVAFGQPVGTVIYTVIGTDANGCQNSDQVTVTVHPLPIINAGIDQQVCEGTMVTLSGSGAQIYLWDNGVTDGVAFLQGLGTVVYTVIGTDVNGCVNSDQVEVRVNPLPIVGAGMDQAACSGSAIVLNGSGANSYAWDNGIIDGAPFIQGIGTTTYTVIGTDLNGCQNSDQVDVTIYPLPNVNAGLDVEVCEGTQVTLTGTGANGYVWNNGVINGIPFIQGVGSVTYTVTGTDLNGCQNTDQVNVLVNPNPVVNAGVDQSLCDGSWITLSAIGAPNLVWDNGVFNKVPFQQGVGVINYTVTGTLPSGCFSTDIVSVTVLQNPIVTADDLLICEGEEAILYGNGAVSYQWSGGVVNGQGFYPNQTGSYTVIGTAANGCTSEAQATVTVNPAPFVDFDVLNFHLTTTNPTTGFDNLSIGAVSYEWNFSDGSPINNEFEPVHTFPEDQPGEYVIELTGYSEFGCSARAIKYVHIFRDYLIYVPNAFTPDNSGVNEVFKPVMTGFDEQGYTMYIFNRWGNLIFETHDMQVGWDGTFHSDNTQVQDGVFTWKIEAKLKDSADTKIFVGHVSILK